MRTNITYPPSAPRQESLKRVALEAYKAVKGSGYGAIT